MNKPGDKSRAMAAGSMIVSAIEVLEAYQKSSFTRDTSEHPHTCQCLGCAMARMDNSVNALRAFL